ASMDAPGGETGGDPGHLDDAEAGIDLYLHEVGRLGESEPELDTADAVGERREPSTVGRTPVGDGDCFEPRQEVPPRELLAGVDHAAVGGCRALQADPGELCDEPVAGTFGGGARRRPQRGSGARA